MDEDTYYDPQDQALDHILEIIGPIRQHRLIRKSRALRQAQQALREALQEQAELAQTFANQQQDYKNFKQQLLSRTNIKASYSDLQLERSQEQKQMKKLEERYQQMSRQQPVVEQCKEKQTLAQTSLTQQQKSCERLTMLEELRRS